MFAIHVIGIKNNSNYVNKKASTDTRLVPACTRSIDWCFVKEYNKELTNKRTNQKDSYRVSEKINYNIATNQDTNYTDEDIKNIYNSRWDIEEYFKMIKSNFKFSIMNEHNKDTPTTYKKSYTIIKIISVLEELFKLVCSDTLVSSKKNLKVTINKSELIKGLFKVIPDIIDSKITYNKLVNFCDVYIIKNYTKIGASNPRTSKIPFTKWYTKGYHKKCDLDNLLGLFLYGCENTDTIDRKLKSKSQYFSFEKIETMWHVLNIVKLK